ncbi:MAG: hypothetical protein ACTS85_00365 [Arsenophonus sp. NC-PG7-MAG3]
MLKIKVSEIQGIAAATEYASKAIYYLLSEPCKIGKELLPCLFLRSISLEISVSPGRFSVKNI